MLSISGDPTLFALFRNQAEAEAGVNALAQSGFAPDQIGYLGPGEEPGDVRQREPAGAVAGGLLGAAASGAVPGLGNVLAAGVLVPLVVGVAAGAGAGGTVGTLLGSAQSDHPAMYFLQEVGAGRCLVSVAGDRLEEAANILLRAGALEASAVRV